MRLRSTALGSVELNSPSSVSELPGRCASVNSTNPACSPSSKESNLHNDTLKPQHPPPAVQPSTFSIKTQRLGSSNPHPHHKTQTYGPECRMQTTCASYAWHHGSRNPIPPLPSLLSHTAKPKVGVMTPSPSRLVWRSGPSTPGPDEAWDKEGGEAKRSLRLSPALILHWHVRSRRRCRRRRRE